MADLSAGAAWMDGKVIPISEAKIGVTDWGLTHSDITYDVVPVRDGGFFRLDDYLDRFHASMAATHMDVVTHQGMDRAAIRRALHQMVGASGLQDAYVAMVASRGSPSVHGSRDPRDCINHFYAWVAPYVHIIKPEMVAAGASALIAEGVHRIPASSVNPLAKNYHWGDFTTGLFQAKEAGYETVILTDHQGNVTEGPGFNVFAVTGDTVVTPDHGILHGISRKTALEMATESGLKTEVRPLGVDELLAADEVFLSSSGGGVLPLTKVNNTIYGNGAPGPVGMQLRALYNDWSARPEYREEIDYAAAENGASAGTEAAATP